MCLTQKSVKHMWSPEASGAHVAVCLLPKSGGGGKAQRRRGFWGGVWLELFGVGFLLEKNARGFKAACEDRELITDLFSRAELD